MTMWAVLGGMAALILGSCAWVGWRDRRRRRASEDATIDRAARARQHAHETDANASPAQSWPWHV
ncbi:hypothetical protein ACVCAH_14340 [Micromonospora sp. LZ34]